MYSAGGKETFLTLPLQENFIPPTHRKNDTSLGMSTIEKVFHYEEIELSVIKFKASSIIVRLLKS